MAGDILLMSYVGRVQMRDDVGARRRDHEANGAAIERF